MGALENLRIDGSIELKKGRNYLVRKKARKSKKSGKKVASKKKTKKVRKVINKEPQANQKVSKFIKNHFKVKKQAKPSKKAKKSVKKVKKVAKTVKKEPKFVKTVNIKSEPVVETQLSETGVEPSTRRTVHPQKTDEEMSFYKQNAQKEEFSGDYGDLKQDSFEVSKNTKTQVPTKTPTKINRKNHQKSNQNRSIRANKTLKQLVILSIKSSDSQGLFFNQIKYSLKNGANVQVSNFILKLTLHQLLNSNHLVKSNQVYKITGKSFNRVYRKKTTETRLSRKARKQVMKQAKDVRNTMKSAVSGLLNMKYKILEKVIMKAMRALKRKAVKSKTRTGFMFNQVKAEVRKVAKHKKIRNVVLIKALENLRIDGSIELKKGRNYLVRKKARKLLARKKPKKLEKSLTKSLKLTKKCLSSPKTTSKSRNKQNLRKKQRNQ